MPKFRTSKEAFTSCDTDGFYNKQAPPTAEEIRTMLDIAEAMLRQAQKLIPLTPQDSIDWTVIFTLHYDALHQLTDAFLQYDNIKSSNHQCLFAYLIEKHPELEFDWGLLEEFRTKRNGVHYYGTPVKYPYYKTKELQIKLYLNTLKKAVEQKLGKNQ